MPRSGSGSSGSSASSSSPPPPVLRGRLWIECDGAAALTEAGADLLEQIQATGSLSEAARRLRFSYRRAWMLLDAMNRRWPQPLVRTAVGGRKGGGAKLTDLGRSVLSAYRDLQVQLETLLDHATPPFRRAVRPDRH
jgi:molybdate transport system regulatory protein